MATFAATSGNGFAMFDEWSQKSAKCDPQETHKRWKGLERPPPTGIGAGTLFHKAREISSSWRMATIDRLAAAANANADDFINDPLGGNAVSVKQMEQQVRHREASQLVAQIDHWLNRFRATSRCRMRDT
jgi:hypothetical protein